MRHRASLLCLIAAWLCANGAPLDVEQAYAWTRMFAGYVRSASVGRAAAETFDPAKPCAICQAVQKARDFGAKPATPASAQRLMLASQQTECVLGPPALRDWPLPGATFAPNRREAVRLRPPRSCA